MDQDEGLTAVDNIVTQFNTYEDFLDSQITTVDLYYLEDESLARQLVELGYRGTGEIVKREDFEARKAAINIARQAERTQKKVLPCGPGRPYIDRNLWRTVITVEATPRSPQTRGFLMCRLDYGLTEDTGSASVPLLLPESPVQCTYVLKSICGINNKN
ncbi:cilia- and flagella-associated protein 299 isoform 3 [Mus musculus]|uniref:cilia- and flagella-associated protein 299 isoform 3 n=1 Tax=Mus musculus TaxID=10090 RepID=UPI0023B04C67|nr:cilia- and flagella-associated protein 299 isoform 3 [Mus musculus]